MIPKTLVVLLALIGLSAGIYYMVGRQVKSSESSGESATLSVAAVTSVLDTVPSEVFFSQSIDRVVLDVRTKDEFAEGHLEHAKVLDFRAPDFHTQLEALPRESPYAIYCRSGNRSGQTLELMKNLGFTDVINLHGGIVAWQASGQSVCTDC